MTADPSPVRVRSAGQVPGPEAVGVLVAVAIVAAFLLVGGLRSGATSPTPGPSGTPIGQATPAPTDGPPSEVAIADLLRVVNQRLLQQAEVLAAELDRDPLRTEETAAIIGEIRATARLGADAADRLPAGIGQPGLGRRLGNVYADLDAAATTALDDGGEDPVAYLTGGTAILEILAELPALQEELTGPPVSASPGASGALPSEPVGPALGPEQIANGGFESGVGDPWILLLADDADATLGRETELPGVGEISARIDITAESAARSGISLRHERIELVAGRRYVVSLWLRSSANRDIRVRVASRDGGVYASQIAIAGPLWAPQSWVFTASASDDDAVLEIDVGRSTLPVWIDAVSLAAETGSAP